MSDTITGYARCSTVKQDLAAQRQTLLGLAEFEVGLLRIRTREGMPIARAKGKLEGKRPKLTPRQQAHLIALHEDGEHTIAELAGLFSVARSTVYRARARARTRTAEGKEAAA